jgi:prophage antirepressor-like protein
MLAALYNTITFENNKIFIICDNNNKIWFHAKQICLSLKYKEPNKAITKNVDKEDKEDKEDKIQLKNMEINF